MKSFHIIADYPSFVVINKAPGVSVHKDNNDSGLAMELSAALGNPVYLVHRLDKVTSGVIVFAKSSSVAAELSKQFADRSVKKFYLALSDQKPTKKQGLIKGDMAKSRRGAWKLTKSTDSPAVTHFFCANPMPGYRLFIVKPSTGKTHQIRVALKSIGSPIIGDALYAGTSADRAYLHAWQLMFSCDGIQYHFSAPLIWGTFFVLPEVVFQLTEWAEPANLAWPQ